MRFIQRFFWALRCLLTQRRGVVFAILSPEKKVLLQLRDQNSKRFKGYWCIPGGRVASDENPLDAAVREIEEEYGLIVRKEKCTHIHTRFFGTNKTYVCVPEPGQTPLLQEGAEMSWKRLSEIEKLNLGFYQEEILPSLKRHLFQN